MDTDKRDRIFPTEIGARAVGRRAHRRRARGVGPRRVGCQGAHARRGKGAPPRPRPPWPRSSSAADGERARAERRRRRHAERPRRCEGHRPGCRRSMPALLDEPAAADAKAERCTPPAGPAMPMRTRCARALPSASASRSSACGSTGCAARRPRPRSARRPHTPPRPTRRRTTGRARRPPPRQAARAEVERKAAEADGRRARDADADARLDADAAARPSSIATPTAPGDARHRSGRAPSRAAPDAAGPPRERTKPGTDARDLVKRLVADAVPPSAPTPRSRQRGRPAHRRRARRRDAHRGGAPITVAETPVATVQRRGHGHRRDDRQHRARHGVADRHDSRGGARRADALVAPTRLAIAGDRSACGRRNAGRIGGPGRDGRRALRWHRARDRRDGRHGEDARAQSPADDGTGARWAAAEGSDRRDRAPRRRAAAGVGRAAVDRRRAARRPAAAGRRSYGVRREASARSDAGPGAAGR